MSQAVLSQAAISVSLIESSVVRCTDVFVCRDVLSVGLHSDDLRRPKHVTHDNERSCLILQGNKRNIPDGLAPGTIGRPKIGECRSCSAGNLRGASCFAPRSRIFAPGADFSSGARLKCSLMFPLRLLAVRVGIWVGKRFAYSYANLSACSRGR